MEEQKLTRVVSARVMTPLVKIVQEFLMEQQ